MADSRYVRVKVGAERVVCIVCGQTTAHDLVVSGVGGRLRRHVPRSDLRHYSLCRACGTKIPQNETGTSGPGSPLMTPSIDLTDGS